jgi:hypothetical protein
MLPLLTRSDVVSFKKAGLAQISGETPNIFLLSGFNISHWRILVNRYVYFFAILETHGREVPLSSPYTHLK